MRQAPRDRCLSPRRCNRYIDTIQADLTASDIMGITLREASEKVGVTRQTLMKAINTGRVSAEKSDNGEWRIEPVELFRVWTRSEEHTSELQSLLRTSYADFCLQ